MCEEFQIFVPRIMDESNYNSQNINAKSLLARFSNQHKWVTTFYNQPQSSIQNKSNVVLKKLLPRRLWHWHLFALYQSTLDAIFYPGPDIYEYHALRCRSLTHRKIPIICTLEGFLGNKASEKRLGDIAGHVVYVQHVDKETLKRANYIYNESDHIIAISPFVAKIGAQLFGEKITYLPLGVDLNTFFPAKVNNSEIFTVVGAGRLYNNKQPHLFIDFAARFPNANFIWYGDGELRYQLQQEIILKKLKNMRFLKPVHPTQLADAFRKANLFILPSLSEGLGKVTQEAVACGLPAIVYGFYEPMAVIDQYNGYIVWNNNQLYERVDELISLPKKAAEMGNNSLLLAEKWDWNVIATQWEKLITRVIKEHM